MTIAAAAVAGLALGVLLVAALARRRRVRIVFTVELEDRHGRGDE